MLSVYADCISVAVSDSVVVLPISIASSASGPAIFLNENRTLYFCDNVVVGFVSFCLRTATVVGSAVFAATILFRRWRSAGLTYAQKWWPTSHYVNLGCFLFQRDACGAVKCGTSTLTSTLSLRNHRKQSNNVGASIHTSCRSHLACHCKQTLPDTASTLSRKSLAGSVAATNARRHTVKMIKDRELQQSSTSET